MMHLTKFKTSLNAHPWYKEVFMRRREGVDLHPFLFSVVHVWVIWHHLLVRPR